MLNRLLLLFCFSAILCDEEMIDVFHPPWTAHGRPQGKGYSDNRYALQPNQNIATEMDEPGDNHRFYVFNYGQTNVECAAETFNGLQYGSMIEEKFIVEQNHEKILSFQNPTWFYKRARLHLKNLGKERAMVQAYGVQQGPEEFRPVQPDEKPPIKAEYPMFLMTDLGAYRFPLDGTLKKFMQTFWPPHGQSVWDILYKRFRTFLDGETVKGVEKVMDNDIHKIHNRFVLLEARMNRKDGKIKDVYLDLLEEIVKLPRHFTHNAVKDNFRLMNYYLLPFYSNTVTFLIEYCRMGLINREDYKFNEDDIEDIEFYLKSTLRSKKQGAIGYVASMHDERIKYGMDTFSPINFYNQQAGLLNFLTVFGKQYSQYWQHIIDDPTTRSKPRDYTVLYTSIFGRRSCRMNRLAYHPRGMLYAFALEEILGEVNPIENITFFIHNNFFHKIDVHYKYGHTISSGEVDSSKDLRKIEVDFKKGYLKELVICGIGRLEYVHMKFQGRSDVKLGGDCRGDKSTYFLDGYRIASIVGASNWHVEDSISTIAISFAKIEH